MEVINDIDVNLSEVQIFGESVTSIVKNAPADYEIDKVAVAMSVSAVSKAVSASLYAAIDASLDRRLENMMTKILHEQRELIGKSTEEFQRIASSCNILHEKTKQLETKTELLKTQYTEMDQRIEREVIAGKKNNIIFVFPKMEDPITNRNCEAMVRSALEAVNFGNPPDIANCYVLKNQQTRTLVLVSLLKQAHKQKIFSVAQFLRENQKILVRDDLTKRQSEARQQLWEFATNNGYKNFRIRGTTLINNNTKFTVKGDNIVRLDNGDTAPYSQTQETASQKTITAAITTSGRGRLRKTSSRAFPPEVELSPNADVELSGPPVTRSKRQMTIYDKYDVYNPERRNNAESSK